jgi:hypothetical protein
MLFLCRHHPHHATYSIKSSNKMGRLPSDAVNASAEYEKRYTKKDLYHDIFVEHPIEADHSANMN